MNLATRRLFSPLKVQTSLSLRTTSTSTSPFARCNSQSTQAKTGIVLMNLGGPETTDKVNIFLNRLFADHEIIPLPFQKFLGPTIANVRTEKVKKLYQSIGGGSPIRKWTTMQGDAMVKYLDEKSPETGPHKYYIAFRYADPLSDEAVLKMKEDGVKRAVAFTQYPQFSCSTTGGSLNELWRALKRNKLEKEFEWSVVDRWPEHPGFIEAVADRINEGLKTIPSEHRDDTILLFSAHSLPIKVINRGDQYVPEVAATIQRVMNHLKFSHKYISTWQSAVGPNWMGPQTVDVVKKLGKRGQKSVLVVPIAFTSDHIETLSEIDIEMAEDAEKAGIEHFRRAPSLNDSPIFSKAMGDIVMEHMKSGVLSSSQYPMRCPGCTNEQCRSIVNPIHHEKPHFRFYDCDCLSLRGHREKIVPHDIIAYLQPLEPPLIPPYFR
ncbi:ferrochelatase [Planoprotostelium fungivorum]|uniref:Ferrochelatase n=1 Tax=Planoprotostelium fungivorum TaxID=1890364 RepID=A0A2P6NXH7_9EUKA|nr:ferrochelatase [Planoprotostelium fungivorum]